MYTAPSPSDPHRARGHVRTRLSHICRSSGIWFLDETALRELDQILAKHWDALKLQRQEDVNNEARRLRSDLLTRMMRSDPSYEVEKEKARKLAEKIHEKEQKTVTLECDGRTVVTCPSFADATRVANKDIFSGFTAVISAGKNTLKIELGEAFLGGDRIRVNATPYCDSTSTALLDVEAWAERYCEPSTVCWFCKNWMMLVLIVGVFAMMLGQVFSSERTAYPHKERLAARAIQLMEAGINEKNRDLAIEMILMEQIETPPKTQRYFSPWWGLGNLVISFTLMGVLMNPPRSILGIGSGRKLQAWRKSWYRFVCGGWLKGVIATILLGVLTNYVWELIRRPEATTETSAPVDPETEKSSK